MKPGEGIYLISDGLADQHNPEFNKMGSLKVRGLIEETHGLPAQEQLQRISEYLERHQAEARQRDDITLLGIKV